MFGEEVVLFEDVVETSYIDVGDKDSTPIRVGGLLHYTSGGPHLEAVRTKSLASAH